MNKSISNIKSTIDSLKKQIHFNESGYKVIEWAIVERELDELLNTQIDIEETMPTNKPNIEVPNHTDKIDEIINICDCVGITAKGSERGGYPTYFTEPYFIMIEKRKKILKAQLRNYISEEIRTVIGDNSPHSIACVNYHKFEDVAVGVCICHARVENNLKTEQLTKARNRGHNV